MNTSNKLLNTLDDHFGFDDKQQSTFRKVAQHFDERTNEHVVLIEYRVRRTRKGRDGKDEPSAAELLKIIHANAEKRRAEKKSAKH